MRRFVTIGMLTALSFLIVMPASAQIFGIGVKGGLNFSTLRGDIIIDDVDFPFSPDLKYKTGFVAGVSFSSRLMPFITLQPEILYSEKGAKIDESISFDFEGQNVRASLEGTIDLKYLEVPVLIKARLPVPGFSPFVYAGPSFAYNLSADVTIDARAGGIHESESADIKDEIKDFDIGLVIGAGMEFGLPMLKLHAEVRYTMGLSNVMDANNGDDLDLKNGVISLMVGVTF